MTEFRFPKTGPHCVTINGFRLIFSTGLGVPLLVNEAAHGLASNCSGMSISKAEDWLQKTYGEGSVPVARQYQQIIEAGYLSEPLLDFEDFKAEHPRPISFGIAITHECNMHCRYCFAANLREHAQPKDISCEMARRAVDFLFDILRPPWTRIELGVTGEPLLKWDLVTYVIEYAKMRSENTGIGASFLITTNGLELKTEISDYIRTHNEVNVTLSWDGPREVQLLQRPGPGLVDSYEVARKAFGMLRERTDSRRCSADASGVILGPMVSATVSGLNPNVDTVFAHLFDAGVRDIAIKPARVVSDPETAITERNLPAFKSAYTRLAQLLLKQDRFQMDRLLAIMNVIDFLGRHILKILENGRVACRCDAARDHYEVDTNGDIYPCPSLVGMADFRIGNVHTGLEEHKATSFRRKTFISNLEACKDCWAKYLCGGPCAYVSVLTSERADIPFAPDCDLTRHLIELAGYVVARLRVERPGLLEELLTLRSVKFDLASAAAAKPDLSSEEIAGDAT